MSYLGENSPEQNQKPDDEVAKDRELKNLLGEWSPPEITSSLDQRILTSYRRQFLHRPLWRRWLTGSISLPAPVAVTAALLLCATSYLAARKATSYTLESAPTPPAVKIVEVPVPVVQKEIVTRVVYKKIGEQKDKGDPTPISSPPRIDLADFRPVSVFKIIVSQGGNDEK
jgi:hypothetical protein